MSIPRLETWGAGAVAVAAAPPERVATSRRRGGGGRGRFGRRHTFNRRANLAREPRRARQIQSARVSGMAASPVGVGTTPSTWCRLTPPSVKPTADPAMYRRQMRACGSSAAATASSQLSSRFAHPRLERAGVVLAERLDVADLEAVALHRQHGVADVHQLAVGEHVASDERTPAELRAALRGDRVVEQPAGRHERPAAGTRSTGRSSPRRRARPCRSS